MTPWRPLPRPPDGADSDRGKHHHYIGRGRYTRRTGCGTVGALGGPPKSGHPKRHKRIALRRSAARMLRGLPVSAGRSSSDTGGATNAGVTALSVRASLPLAAMRTTGGDLPRVRVTRRLVVVRR